jgi:hypothetical protein
MNYLEIKNKYSELFDFTKNIYKNSNIFEEMIEENINKINETFNNFIIDINNSDYNEDFERNLIYHHSQKLSLEQEQINSFDSEIESEAETDSETDSETETEKKNNESESENKSKSENDGIKCSIKHTSKIMELARYVKNRPNNDSNLNFSKEESRYLTFYNRDIDDDFSGLVMIFAMYYLEKQQTFNPEEPIYGCTFALNPLYYSSTGEEQRDIGLSGINSSGDENCKTIIFKSYFIEL